MYGELMKEMSLVRSETQTKEEEDREKLKDLGKVTGLYQFHYNLNIFTNLYFPWIPFVFNYNNYLFFLIELKNWNRFSIDYHDTWDDILPQ